MTITPEQLARLQAAVAAFEALSPEARRKVLEMQRKAWAHTAWQEMKDAT